ncbi:hypothetical protein NCS52_01588600 [Fusarium sp. LHS14.1]|nr:hypothetical protein NCS52_01588600 [Fusarium sp. LHS14.1]
MWYLVVTVKREHGRSPYQQKWDVPVWLVEVFPSKTPVEGVGSHIEEDETGDVFWIPYSSEEECEKAWSDAVEGLTSTWYNVAETVGPKGQGKVLYRREGVW